MFTNRHIDNIMLFHVEKLNYSLYIILNTCQLENISQLPDHFPKHSAVKITSQINQTNQDSMLYLNIHVYYFMQEPVDTTY